jgi:hypothetical protein
MNLKKLSCWVPGLPWLMFATGVASGSGNVIDDGLASTSQAVSVDERHAKPGSPTSVTAFDTGSFDRSSLSYRPPSALTLFDFNRWSPGYAHIQQQFLGSSTIYQTGTYMSVHSPAVPISQRANHSLAQVWVMSGSKKASENCTTDCIQALEAGWIVDPGDYGDSNPHFFIYATNNGYGQTALCRDYVGGPNSQYGCLEFDLAGYPPVSPGDVLASSVPGGTQEELHIIIANDSNCYGWSVYVNNWLVGIWPASQFTGTMRCSAENFVVGGEVYASPGRDSYTAVHMCQFAAPCLHMICSIMPPEG